MIHKTRYVLAVPDLARSCNYYQDVLGFKIIEVGDPGWRFAERDHCFLMLGECPDAISPNELGDHSYFAYWEVEDAKNLYEDWKSKGAEILTPLADKPWGMREFPLKTIDGHRIMIGESIEKTILK